MPMYLRDAPMGRGITALADAVAGIGPARAEADYRAAQIANLRADNERAQAQLDLQRQQAALADKRFAWEQDQARLAEQREAAKFPLEQQKLQEDLAAAVTSNQLEDARVASLQPTAETMTDAVVANVEKKMPAWDLGASLKAGGPAVAPYMPPLNLKQGGLLESLSAPQEGGMDTMGYGSTAGMDSVLQRDQYRNDVRNQVSAMAQNEVLANKDLDAAAWIEAQTKAYAGSGGYRPATPEEKMAFGVRPDAPMMMTPEGKPDVISNAGGARPSSVEEYEYARQQGYKGTYEEFLLRTTAAKGGVLPAEMGARIGLGNEFLSSDLPQIKKDVEEGTATGVLDYAWGQMGYGRSGEIQRRVMTGVDALRRNLTGAGMGQGEVEEYVRRYMPTWLDTSDSLLSKLDGLERDLNASKDGAIDAKAGNMTHSPGGPPQADISRINPNDVATLKADPSPDAQAEFDSIYGAGAAQQVLGGR